jgi:mono/diheme cytochrome c family protein
MFTTILLGALLRAEPKQDSSALSTMEFDSIKAQKIYYSQCISCHHKDPHLKGALGPELSGIPLEVFKLKVLQGKYPVGYNPKRKTNLMKPIRIKEQDVMTIHEWINLMQKKSTKR